VTDRQTLEQTITDINTHHCVLVSVLSVCHKVGKLVGRPKLWTDQGETFTVSP